MGKIRPRKKFGFKPQYKAYIGRLSRFDCLVCQRKECCTIQIDSNKKHGKITCLVCKVTFETTANNLSKPVDIYTKWVDAVEGEGDIEY